MYNTDITAKLVLKNYQPYAKLVSDAYLARPLFEPEYAKSWKVLMQNLKVMYKRLQSHIKFEMTEEDPYSSMEEMREDVKGKGVLKIYTGESHHPIWTPEENCIFRAVHDALGHLAGYKKGKGHRFDLRGEIGVYNRQLKVVSPDARDALFTELVGQVCAAIVTGKFQKQKICKLHGFDYLKVGLVDEAGYKNNFQVQPNKIAAFLNSVEKLYLAQVS